jgi:hypothetical protein
MSTIQAFFSLAFIFLISYQTPALALGNLKALLVLFLKQK